MSSGLQAAVVQFQILNFCFPARLLILFVSIWGAEGLQERGVHLVH